MKIINWLYLWFKWFIFLIVNQVTNLISFPLVPIFVLFVTKENKLPKCLYWFDTFDCDLSGDPGWKEQNRPYLIEDNAFKRWVNRWRWLWRNRMYGFSYSILSVKYVKATDIIAYTGDIDIGNCGPAAKSGSFFKTITRGKWITGFQYYRIKQYKRWPNKCTRLLIGWKLADLNEGDVVQTFGFSPSPWMRFGD